MLLMLNKRCKICKEVKLKPLTDFHVRAKADDGHQGRCKSCACALAKEWRDQNIDRARENSRRYYRENKESVRATNARWAAEHPDMMLDYCRNYRARNPGKDAAKNRRYRRANPEKVSSYFKRYHQERPGLRNQWDAERRAREIQAMPPWTDRNAIAALYREARRLSRETGVPHHVDHIVPLSHPLVCGLHVPLNLQILTGPENMRKSNSFVVL